MSDYKILIWYGVVSCVIVILFWIRDRLKIQKSLREFVDEHAKPRNWR